MASYIIVCSEVRSTIGGVKTCFRLSFSGVLEYPGVNSISISSSVHLHRKILRNCKRISMDTSYLIINILLIATFLYKNNYWTSILRLWRFISISFTFPSISSLKKGQTASLVQKSYFVAISGRASPTSFQSSHHTARAHFYSGNFM
jgi:hypothetical protein